MKSAGWVFVMAMTMSGVVAAQVEITPMEEVFPYNVDAISFASATSRQSRIDVYIQVPFATLSFVKMDGGYRASYEMTIDVVDSSGRLVSEKLWTEEIKAETFEGSTSPQAYSLVQRVFEVPPGNYSIVTIVHDTETQQSKRQTRTLIVSNFALPEFSLSDIMLISKLSLDGEKKVIVPSVSPNVGMIPDAFHIFFEAYNIPPIDSVRFVVDILNEKKETAFRVTQTQSLVPGRNQIFIKVPNNTLPVGNYMLYVRSYPANDSSEVAEKSIATTGKNIVVRWRGLPIGAKDIDLAIEQCVYIAKDKEMGYMREATTPEEKQKRFIEFWRKRDPNPNTPRNEKMEQYFERVEYANKTFKHYIEGWRTDMGMVYIIFGVPNNIDRHPFDIGSKPYEVWTYYDMNHSFVFADQNGFGDYRLTTPIWEVWQRPKD